jgi:hypothetical protein
VLIAISCFAALALLLLALFAPRGISIIARVSDHLKVFDSKYFVQPHGGLVWRKRRTGLWALMSAGNPFHCGLSSGGLAA